MQFGWSFDKSVTERRLIALNQYNKLVEQREFLITESNSICMFSLL